MKNEKRKANMEKYRAVLGAIGRENKLPGAEKGPPTAWPGCFCHCRYAR